MRNKPPVSVSTIAPFNSAAKRLKKKYPHIGEVIRELVTQLQQGETPGDQIQGTQHTVYKVRLPNIDTRRGKSGGYRVIYYLKTGENVILVYIYSKMEREDRSADEIRRLIEEAE